MRAARASAPKLVHSSSSSALRHVRQRATRRAGMAVRAAADVEHDVIICGGGIVAASIAYHLTLRGAWRCSD
jgi:hypothetical protein